MQVQQESIQDAKMSQDEIIQQLQQQVANLTQENATLRDQLESREQFTTMIVHELRNPLAPIMNYAKILSRHTCAPSENAVTKGKGNRSNRVNSIQRGTGIIMGQARRMNRLVNDLLDSNRLSSNRFSLMRSLCDLGALVQEVVESIRPVSPYHTFDVLLPDEPVIGNWDSERLQQVIGNLLDNAAKYSDDCTTITTHIWTTPGQAHVSVHNQGSSIPSADMEQLFQPYIRLKTASGRQGLGLGLYIAHSIIEAHAGKLRLEPYTDKDSKGTTFIFDLPM